MKYKSEIIKEIVDTSGHTKSTLHYQSECVETSSETIKPLLDIEVPVEAITQNLNSFIEEE